MKTIDVNIQITDLPACEKRFTKPAEIDGACSVHITMVEGTKCYKSCMSLLLKDNCPDDIKLRGE